MNIQFLFENGKVPSWTSMADLNQCIHIADEEQFRLETFSFYTQYLAQLPLESEREEEIMQIEERKPNRCYYEKNICEAELYTLFGSG